MLGLNTTFQGPTGGSKMVQGPASSAHSVLRCSFSCWRFAVSHGVPLCGWMVSWKMTWKWMRTGGSPIKMHINGPFQETFQKNQDDSSNLQQWIGTDHLEIEGCCVVVGKNLRTSRVTERCNKVKKEPSQSSGHLNIHQDEHRQSYLVFPRRKSLRGPGPYEFF
jgi:hypothetical protein